MFSSGRQNVKYKTLHSNYWIFTDFPPSYLHEWNQLYEYLKIKK